MGFLDTLLGNTSTSRLKKLQPYIKQINDKGGIMGRKVEAIYEDEEANPNVAVQKAAAVRMVQCVGYRADDREHLVPRHAAGALRPEHVSGI